MNTLSIIVPALDEEQHIGPCLAALSTAFPDAELIVVDAHSSDATVEIAARQGAHVVTAPRNRGYQLNAGAERARGELLCFVHADSRIAADAGAVVDRWSRDPANLIATFAVRFDADHPLYRFMEWAARRDTRLTTYGDQGMLIRRSFFEELGGFRPMQLFEDVEFFARARQRTRIGRLPATLTTSARKFERNGVWPQHAWNTVLHALYRAGAPSESLAALYRWSRR